MLEDVDIELIPNLTMFYLQEEVIKCIKIWRVNFSQLYNVDGFTVTHKF